MAFFITDLIDELNRYYLQTAVFFIAQQDHGAPVGQASRR